VGESTNHTPPPVDPSDRQAVIHFLAAVPKPRAVLFAVRCATRVAPLILNDHPEALERLNAVEAVLRIIDAWANGTEVSRFTLRLVRDIAYDVADVCEPAGPTLYAAAAVIDADPSRSVASAVRETLKCGNDDTRNGFDRDFDSLALGAEFGPLWPDGEPEWSRTAWAKLHSTRSSLVSLFLLPASN
jgi:hypothetical protein